MRTIRQGSFLILLGILVGCADIHYSQIKGGKLTGKLLVEWIDADLFIFTPDNEKPLTFTRYNTESITPGRMLTDGGSIPRPLWVMRSYSPWGYGPAFIVHDWLFEMRHCQYEGFEKYSFEESAKVLSEVIKTLMVDPKYKFEDSLSMYAIYEAVRSPIAKKRWDEGTCSPPPPRVTKDKTLPNGMTPKILYVIEFP